MSEICVGTKLYGFCGGYFGRDSYTDKVIEAMGHDWVVARNIQGGAEFVRFNNALEMQQLLAVWSIERVI